LLRPQRGPSICAIPPAANFARQPRSAALIGIVAFASTSSREHPQLAFGARRAAAAILLAGLAVQGFVWQWRALAEQLQNAR